MTAFDGRAQRPLAHFAGARPLERQDGATRTTATRKSSTRSRNLSPHAGDNGRATIVLRPDGAQTGANAPSSNLKPAPGVITDE
jgi:hypothetical protein